MENYESSEKTFSLSFQGKGGEYFGIVIVNWLLTVITLGIYYPWAKAKQIKYLYGATSLNDDRFLFSGTGKEMFIGFVKTMLIFGVILGLFYTLFFLVNQVLALIVLYLLLFLVMPLAIHGSYRYRMSRTSWRGIRFGYRGDKWEFFVKYLKWIFLTIITLGIYASWMEIKSREYIFGNIKAGDAQFKYKGSGSEFFLLNLKGYLLTLITLGIYMFWWEKDLFNYLYGNLSIEKGETKIQFKSTATGGGFFKLEIVNLLILVFTLGLGFAWVITRTMSFYTKHIELTGDIDLNSLEQTEEEYNNALGDDLTDFFDINLIF
jgi:uncharacterized membrane protein YjgN (DUF898 family)